LFDFNLTRVKNPKAKKEFKSADALHTILQKALILIRTVAYALQGLALNSDYYSWLERFYVRNARLFGDIYRDRRGDHDWPYYVANLPDLALEVNTDEDLLQDYINGLVVEGKVRPFPAREVILALYLGREPILLELDQQPLAPLPRVLKNWGEESDEEIDLAALPEEYGFQALASLPESLGHESVPETKLVVKGPVDFQVIIAEQLAAAALRTAPVVPPRPPPGFGAAGRGAGFYRKNVITPVPEPSIAFDGKSVGKLAPLPGVREERKRIRYEAPSSEMVKERHAQAQGHAIVDFEEAYQLDESDDDDDDTAESLFEEAVEAEYEAEMMIYLQDRGEGDFAPKMKDVRSRMAKAWGR